MTSEIEYLNECLIKERDELKDALLKKDEEIKHLVKGFQEFAHNYLKMKIPFGSPNDHKIIEVLVSVDTYENEIKPYNELMNKIVDALKKEAIENELKKVAIENELDKEKEVELI